MRVTREAHCVREPLGESAAMRALRREIAAIAPLRSTVLLTGETGVGKGVVARELHRGSRRSRPFVHVDCAALAPTMIESELFGHERGAFTGAVAQRPGRFELAGDGTILLDEIGELEPPLQAKLLRVLQDREFERIGGARTLGMRARVVAATSCDLRRDVREGRFRADLYFRLAVVHLAVPPLRERRVDIPVLARIAVAQLSEGLGLPPPVLSQDLLARLADHSWPGNVRELSNVLERLLIRRPGALASPSDLDGILDDALWPAPQVETLARLSQCAGDRVAPIPSAERIASVLRACGGNVACAARQLGMPRTTLRRHIHRYGLSSRPPS